MKKLLQWLLVLILLILLFSCSSGKSIVGKKWYKGWRYSDESGTLIPKCRSKRYRGATGG